MKNSSISISFPRTRMRRTRMRKFSLDLVQETRLSTSDLIYPLFVIEGHNKKEEIKSMPNIFRKSSDLLLKDVENCIQLGIKAIAIFPYISKKLKDDSGSESINPDNLICNTVRKIKKEFPDIGIICDVALDPYTTHGHDGLIINEQVDNDKTIHLLEKQSLNQAISGCDIIAPSDMMDGRVGKIRDFLDKNNYINVQIMSYAAKFSSSFYYPFREAIGSNYIGDKIDKSSYQINPGNSNESIRGVSMDISEGADMIIVKPGMNYLDIIYRIKNTYEFPTFAYQVSGEYAMLEHAFQKKILKKSKTLIETLLCFKRAGADGILTYFACDAAKEIIKLK